MVRMLGKSAGSCALAIGLIAAASVLAPPFRAQESALGVTRVATVPDSIWFYVDGQIYRGAQTFNWPAGSKHTLAIDDTPGQLRPGVRYNFRNWQANGTVLAQGNPVTIAADPSISSFQAVFDPEYALSVAYFVCDEDPTVTCNSPGKVYVGGGSPITSSTIVWATPDATISLQAVPNPGYIFAGWNTSGGQAIQGFLNSVTLSQPITITPRFQVARKIRLETDPPDLQLVADRAALYTPKELEWGRGSVHTLSPVSPQQDRGGNWWVFSSWNDGGTSTHSYKVGDTMAPETVIAAYSPALRATVATSPPLLRLKIDGRDAAPPYNLVWGVQEKHRVEAPARQTDSQGRTWEFEGWSDGLPAAHEVTVPAESINLGLRLTATYRQLGRVTVATNPAGLKAQIDGAECATPCTVERPLGEIVRFSAPASLRLGDDSRADFDRWSDGTSALAASVAAAAAPLVLTAEYRVLNRLVVSADPGDAAVCRTSPESPDGFFERGSAVAVSMIARPGYRFRRWEGDLNGAAPAATVLMSAPRSARATFDRVPYIAPAGVRNAAGDTGADGVAPGSVVAIAGANLAGEAVTGPENPLLQTLGDVTVRAGDRLLPLFFVSAERITAQLPADLPEGASALAVRWAGQPEVRAPFTVVRNAPGLFQNFVAERACAVAFHEDGSLVSAASPARPGEKLTLLGSGFGPTRPERPLGFAVPPQPAFVLLDELTLRVADRAVPVESAYAAPGRTGVDAVEFRLPDGLPKGEPVPIAVLAGGRESNLVYLPVE